MLFRVGPCHGVWVEEAVEFDGVEDFFLEGEGADGLACCEGTLGEGGGGVVADDWCEGCAHGEGALDEGLAAFGIWLEAFEKFVCEDVAGVGEEMDGGEDGVCHDRHGDVEIEE